MKKKNGFTLVELLAVIVVLALIMVIAIPSVLKSMNKAKKQTFGLMIEKVYNAAVTKFTYDQNLGSAQGAGWYIYDVTTDLDMTSTGDYKGYVVVNATSVEEPKYFVYLYDKSYMTSSSYNDVTTNGLETVKSKVTSFVSGSVYNATYNYETGDTSKINACNCAQAKKNSSLACTQLSA